jgi:hypothetical protein
MKRITLCLALAASLLPSAASVARERGFRHGTVPGCNGHRTPINNPFAGFACPAPAARADTNAARPLRPPKQKPAGLQSIREYSI